MRIQDDPSLIRCPWCLSDPLYRLYHDQEWGVPLENDQDLFEFLILEGAQAGLSWLTILKRREHYRRAFKQFDPQQVARFTEADQNRLLQDSGIIRNRLKISAAIGNAQAFLKLLESHGSFAKYMWEWVEGRPVQHHFRSMKEIPAQDKISEAWSRDMKKRGFRFVGPTILYAHMQAVGMVNDHLTDCFRHSEVKKLGSKPQSK